MRYKKTVKLKDGRECIVRSGEEKDGRAVLENFILTHTETDFLLTYPDECTMTVEQEEQFVKAKAESENEIELVAEIDGNIVGSAGVAAVGGREKVRHRADFGISIAKGYWGLGIGRAMAKACIECAKAAGFSQLELDVIAENERAISLYKSLGFVEYGRNPKGFRSRFSGWQELVLMLLDLTGNAP